MAVLDKQQERKDAKRYADLLKKTTKAFNTNFRVNVDRKNITIQEVHGETVVSARMFSYKASTTKALYLALMLTENHVMSNMLTFWDSEESELTTERFSNSPFGAAGFGRIGVF